MHRSSHAVRPCKCVQLWCLRAGVQPPTAAWRWLPVVGGWQAIAYVVSAMPLPMVQAAMPEMVNPLLVRVQALAGQFAAGDRAPETKQAFSNTLRRCAAGLKEQLLLGRNSGRPLLHILLIEAPRSAPYRLDSVLVGTFG